MLSEPFYTNGDITIYNADCRDVLPTIEDNSIDAVVTDPPAGIAFMAKWDTFSSRTQFVEFITEVMRSCLRVLKPGGHAFVWSLPRTSHWTGYALEDAGFEIRDCVTHLFGNGLPKGYNVKDTGQGWSSALRPSAELWWLVRKSLDGTIQVNFETWGTGALHIDACRLGPHDMNQEQWDRAHAAQGQKNCYGQFKSGYKRPVPSGRFPTNVVLDGDVADDLDLQHGIRKSSKSPLSRGPSGMFAVQGGLKGQDTVEPRVLEGGGVSRYFYCARSSPNERGSENNHPTVKPLALMNFLTTMICPPGGIVLDPFTGSGSTALSCLQKGFRFLGMEKEMKYCSIAAQRISRLAAVES